MPIIRSNDCPNCGYKSDAATCFDDDELTPVEGDLSICLNCGDFLQYGTDLILEPMRESVWDDIDQETFNFLLHTRKNILVRGRLN